MKKLNKIMLALSILPTLLTSVFLFFMNDTVPMHYNASGAVFSIYLGIHHVKCIHKQNDCRKNHCDT